MGTRLKIVIGALGLFSLIIGAQGVYCLLDSSIPVGTRVVEALYSSIQLFTLAYPDWLIFEDGGYWMNWQIQVARLLSPFITVTALISLFSSTIEKWFKRFCVKHIYRGHAVVFGFNLRSRMICEDLVRQNIRVVLSDPNLTIEEKEWLSRQGVIVFDLSGTDSLAPAVCRVEKADYLFATHEDDSLNLKILVVMYQRSKEVYGSSVAAKVARKHDNINTRCFIHFSEVGFRHLKFGDQFSDLGDYFALRIFSVYEHSARMLTRSIYMKYSKLILSGKHFRILLIGTGKTGQALLEQLIRMSFFNKDRRATISVFDDQWDGWDALEARFPIITLDKDYYSEEDAGRIRALKEQIGFPEIDYVNTSFDSLPFLTGKAFLEETEQETVTIAILGTPDATRNLTIADALMQQDRTKIDEIIVRTDEKDTEIRSFIRTDLKKKRLSNFPTIDEICKLRRLEEGAVERLGKVIHEEYLAELAGTSGTQPSFQSWADLDETFKESNRRAASHIEIKCSLLGMSYLDLDNPETVKRASIAMCEQLNVNAPQSYLELLADCEHSRWCIEKLLDGWVPGKERNDSKKEHPNLVPWEIEGEELEELFAGYKALTDSDKQKDRNNIEKIPELLDKLIEELEKQPT